MIDFQKIFTMISSVKVDENEIYKGLFRSRKFMNQIF